MPDDRVRMGTAANDGGRPIIAIIADHRHARDVALRDTVATLEQAGGSVHLVVPEPDELFDVPATPSWDAVVSRGRSPAVLSLLAAAVSLDVLAINAPRAIDLVRNKIAMQSILARHGMPLPRAWFATDPAVFARVPLEHFPLVVKPFDGDGSAGLSLLTDPADIDLLPPRTGDRMLYIAQEYLDAHEQDLKLYAVGSDVWAVRKPSPVRFDGAGPALAQDTSAAELVAIDAHLRDIALTCGRACGLDLWGVDVALTARGPYVIEVNEFPTYSAVPNAGQHIARHILALTQIDRLRRTSGREKMRSLVWNLS